MYKNAHLANLLRDTFDSFDSDKGVGGIHILIGARPAKARPQISIDLIFGRIMILKHLYQLAILF